MISSARSSSVATAWRSLAGNSKADADSAAAYLLSAGQVYSRPCCGRSVECSERSKRLSCFETLNDRGQDLSAMDLVKNHLFGLAASANWYSRLKEMEQRWAQMIFIFTKFRLDDFLKVYWTSRYGRVQSAEFFEAFKSECKTPDGAFERSMDMLKASEHYVALTSTDDVVWRPYSNSRASPSIASAA